MPWPLTLQRVSIHPPRVGRDPAIAAKYGWDYDVSIHPPRVGRDSGSFRRSKSALCFNPPSPCGEGPKVPTTSATWEKFQSTLPVWGGTFTGRENFKVCLCFNPPSPCGEGQFLGILALRLHIGFNPPSPCGEGQQKFTKILCKLLR